MGVEYLIAATLLSTGITVYGQQQQKKEAKRVAEFNAAIARNNAVAAQQWSRYNEDREREKQRYRRSQMLVNFLKSGVTLEGTPLDVLEEQVIQDEMDAIAIRRQGQAEAQDFRNQATIGVAEAAATGRAKNIESAGTILSGGAKVAEYLT